MEENKTAGELNEALKGLWDSLTDEQKEKAKACRSMDELAALAGQMGVELPDELLESVAGGVVVERGDGKSGYAVYKNERGHLIGRKRARGFDKKEEAVEFAQKKGYGANVMSEEEFERRKAEEFKSGC